MVLTTRARTGSSPRLTIWWAPSSPAGNATTSPGGSSLQPAREHDQHLFVGRVGVVGKRRLAGRHLIQADPQFLGAGLPAELRSPVGEAGPVLVGVEVGFEAVSDGLKYYDASSRIPDDTARAFCGDSGRPL